jgi:hypothetical protein
VFRYQIADSSDLFDQSNHPFKLVLDLSDILSAVATTVAVGSANRDRVSSKPPTRQLVPPSAALFLAALSRAGLVGTALSGAALSFSCSF